MHKVFCENSSNRTSTLTCFLLIHLLLIIHILSVTMMKTQVSPVSLYTEIITRRNHTGLVAGSPAGMTKTVLLLQDF